MVKEYNYYRGVGHKLYDSDSGPGQQLHSQSSPGDLAVVEGQRNGKFNLNGKFGQNHKLGHSCVRVTNGRFYDSQVRYHVFVHLGLNVSSTTHNCGCVVDAMAAI